MLATSQQGSIPGEVEFANSEALHPKQHAEPSLISRSLSASLASNDAQPSQPSRKPVPVPQHTRVPSSRLDQFQQIRMSDKPVLLEAADRRFARESATTGSRGDSAATSVRRGVRAAAVLPFGIPMDKMVSAKPEEVSQSSCFQQSWTSRHLPNNRISFYRASNSLPISRKRSIFEFGYETRRKICIQIRKGLF